MVWRWISSEVGEVVGFVGRAMGCFFGCFRVKDSNSNLIAPREPVVPRSKNALSSLFLNDDESLRKGEEGRKTLPEKLRARVLKDEANFLKACGTLSETRLEIRKALEKWDDKPAQSGEEKSSRLNSRLPNASIEKLKIKKQTDEFPMPVQLCEKRVTGSGSLVDSPSSCITDGYNTRRAFSISTQKSDIQDVVTPKYACDSETHSETSSVSPRLLAPSAQSKNKPVCFDYESDRSALSSKGYSSGCTSQCSKQSALPNNRSVTKPSPYPITNEMQTPGTVFPAHMNDVAHGKVTKDRSQDVYSVLDPVENPNPWKELKDENSDSNDLGEALKLNDEAALMSTPILESAVKQCSVGKEMENEASLSSWLKPPSAKQDDNNKKFGSISGENVHRCRTPVDRPILGMVAAHWNNDETSHVSPKWWDGKGIPNSTNKYKEDQKVSWHATPFEERLEKALSEETFVSQRKPISGTPPVEFNETEESDTALSHRQSSAHFKSVVSF